MDPNNNLKRFLEAQNQVYLTALAEIKAGSKETHWMWFVFPQMKGLGNSSNADFYGISSLEEAEAFLRHPVLGKHLIEISETLLSLQDKTATDIFGSPDNLKLASSMTLFANVSKTNPIFQKVLVKFFEGREDNLTLRLINKEVTHSSIIAISRGV
jgi:uncharacterized protein (DUF1810 family)